MQDSGPLIWYVHPYAGGPGIGRYDRPFQLSKYWANDNVRSIVIAPSFHHLLDNGLASGGKVIAGVRYEFLKSPTYSGNRVGRLINMAWFAAMLLFYAPSLVRRYGKPSLIIASSPHPYIFPSTHLLAKLLRAQSVFEVRDLWPLSLIELASVSRTNMLVKITGWIERFAYRRADFVVSLLPCTFSYMAERGLERRRWRYIPNGIEPEVQDCEAGDAACIGLAKAWQGEGRTVVVYAGALGLPNFVESLIEGLVSVPIAQRREFGIIIVGRGERQSVIKKLIAEYELDEIVAVFEQVPKATVHTLLQYTSVGYIALRPQPLFRFGVSPNKLFDYMVAAIPIIYAVQSGNNPVEESGCGLSVDPADPAAIAEALLYVGALSEEARTEMGSRGRLYALNKHHYKSLAREYLHLLKDKRC